MKTTIIALCLAAVLLGGLTAGADMLVSFAIGRDTGTTDVAPESTLPEESVQNISRNWEQQAGRAEEWAGRSEIEKVRVRSDDGLMLSGEAIITDPSSHLWVIAVHGYRGTHSYMAVSASRFAEQGYNALLPDLRGCGESEGEYIGMGWPDRLDMLQWIDWIIRRDSEARIVLYGISMGGATVMMTAGEELPDQVKAVVEDCGYTSVRDIFSDEMAVLFHLPDFPLLNIASQIASVRAGYSFLEASALEQVAKARVPILFIHGSEDNFVHTDMVYRVYDACASEKQLLVVEGAGHGSSLMHAPDIYFETVFHFLEQYIW